MAKEYEVGDEVWYIAYGINIVIKCKITYVDRQWRDRHYAGILFYDIDEPIGHSLNAEELFDNFDELREEIKLIENLSENFSLVDFRKSRLGFITSTWKNTPPEEKKISDLLLKYPEKKYGSDWFNLLDLSKPISPKPEKIKEDGNLATAIIVINLGIVALIFIGEILCRI